jgi:hypothetical protein
MKWIPHYTGIDVAQVGNLYLQRSSKTKKLEFARVHVKRHILGIKLGRLIHGSYERGNEIFTNNLHIGIGERSTWGVYWSGSSRDPMHTYTLRLGRLRLGSRTDEWLKRLIQRRLDRQLEREFENYDN